MQGHGGLRTTGGTVLSSNLKATAATILGLLMSVSVCGCDFFFSSPCLHEVRERASGIPSGPTFGAELLEFRISAWLTEAGAASPGIDVLSAETWLELRARAQSGLVDLEVLEVGLARADGSDVAVDTVIYDGEHQARVPNVFRGCREDCVEEFQGWIRLRGDGQLSRYADVVADYQDCSRRHLPLVRGTAEELPFRTVDASVPGDAGTAGDGGT